MATAPLLNLFDNSGTTTNLVITTNMTNVILTGTVDSNTVDIQININGQGFISDPTLVGVNLPTFTVPNLNSLPNGLILDNGVNTIELRAIDISGSVSPNSIATITVVNENDLSYAAAPPTGVILNRYSNYVEITWSKDSLDTTVTGYNVYASTGPGGTDSGYLRLNSQLIPVDNPVSTSFSEYDAQEVTYEFTESDISDKDLKVSYTTISAADGTVIQEKSSNLFTLLPHPKYRVRINFSGVEVLNSYKFTHNRSLGLVSGLLNSDTFGGIPPEDPIYYVVTSVYVSPITNEMVESRYSIEMAGSPLPLNVDVRGIRIRDQSQVAQDYIRTLQTVAPELSLIPGSTVREIHIEPFSNEIQKAYLLMDFVHRAKSFSALLAIDDPNQTGTSIPVADSQYKTNLKAALATNDDASVQALIDNAFDSLAKNFGENRKGRSNAVVEQIFYTSVRPVRDLYVATNAIVRSSSDPTAPRFISKGTFVLPASTASRYYNYEKRRYELKVQMIADTPGSIGNVSAGSLDTVVSGATGFSTINESAGFGGQDIQTNTSLAQAATRSLISLDTGTSGGYEKTVRGVPGVISYLVVSSGSEFMMRDYDPVRKKHIGGKVDVYIKGDIDRTVSQTFAFQFNVARNVRFDVIDPINLVFRARDSRLSSNNPIQEMLYNPNEGTGLYNFSNLPVTPYDLTGVTYVDYRTIKLNTSIPQPTTSLDDFVEGDYRYRSNGKFVPGLQPVKSVASVVGEISGAISPGDGFVLYKTQDPLIDGGSTIATDYIEINQISDVPSGLPIQVNDEQHVLIGQIEEMLMSVGINIFTINVYSQDRSVLYNGPDQMDPDYLIIEGTQTTPVKIVRTALSNIPNGSTVSVDYEHDENFVVTYSVNDVLQRVQKELDKMKHLTADVVAKQAIDNPLDIIATVQLKPGYEQSTVDNNIRTSYSELINRKNVGDAVHVSDVTAVIDDAIGVDFVVQPYAKMSLLDGAQRVRDSVASEYTFLPNISSGLNAVYILTEPLPFATMDGGGTPDVHFGVFKDDMIMNKAASIYEVSQSVNNAYIIGYNGAVISGYSDDATLYPLFITPEAVAAERLNRTANRVLVSLDYGQTPIDLPSDHKFSASYIVRNDKGSKDVDTSEVEYLSIGSLTLTFRKA